MACFSHWWTTTWSVVGSISAIRASPESSRSMAAVTTASASVSAGDSSGPGPTGPRPGRPKSAMDSGGSGSAAVGRLEGDVSHGSRRYRPPPVGSPPLCTRRDAAPVEAHGPEPLGHQLQPVHGLDHRHPDVAAPVGSVQLAGAHQQPGLVGQPLAQRPPSANRSGHGHPQVERPRPAGRPAGRRRSGRRPGTQALVVAGAARPRGRRRRRPPPLRPGPGPAPSARRGAARRAGR